MPEDFSSWTPRAHLLTRSELLEVVTVAVDNGITTVRLTGGEPLLHPDVVAIVSDIAKLPRPPRIALTTNGVLLAKLAQPLADAGLDRVNVSLDTLDAVRFQQITKRDRFHEVLAGIKAAQDSGLKPLKVNAVLQRGINDDEAFSLLHHAIAHGWSLRFIEQMPLDPQGLWARNTMITADEILAQLSTHFDLQAVPSRGAAPAEEFLVDGGPATVGVIASVTRPFCGACDRLRITADGQIRNCLFAHDETDLRAILRDPLLNIDQRHNRIASVLALSILDKKAGHGINDPQFLQPTRPMSGIGG